MSAPCSRIPGVLVAVEAEEGGGGSLRPLTDAGVPLGPPESVPDLIAAVASRERADAPRWLWASTAALYPRFLAAGVRLARCHDFELTEALLLGYEGHWGAPRSVVAAWARRAG